MRSRLCMGFAVASSSISLSFLHRSRHFVRCEQESNNNEDYQTLLLRHCYQRIPQNKQSDSLPLFESILNPSSNTQSSSANMLNHIRSRMGFITEDAFVRSLRPLLHNVNLFDTHRKLSSATYQCTATNNASNPDIFGASNLANTSSLRFDLSPTAITSLTNEIEIEIKNVMDKVANLSDNELTTQNVLLPLIQCDQRLSGIENSVCFLQNVHPSQDVRNASNEAQVELSKFGVEISMRKDVYTVIKKYSQQSDLNLDPEWERYLKFLMRDFERMGLNLDDENYEKIKKIKKRMSELSSTFQKNLNEENAQFYFSESDLIGMPNDWLTARQVSDEQSEFYGMYQISLKYPDLFPILKQCKNEKTREQMLRAHNSRCMDENTQIIEELVKMRYEQAQILGKRNHSEHVLEIRMAKTPKTVLNFLYDLNERMQPLADNDLKCLLALKEKEKKAANEEFDGVIHEHDFRYYCTLREEEDFNIDKEALREYFPLQTVIDGALNIYQSLLGLTFQPIKQSESQFAFWHDEVEQYQVIDTKSGELMGHFFLDLHPRQGKYGHACKITLQTGCRIYDDDGSEIGKQFPVNVMLCNFPKPTSDKPSLLSHDDVVTFFHEFGHVMHQICGQPLLSRFAGTAVERDFVEAPSQMLENWCWKGKALNLMSGHYEDSNKKIPNDLLDKLAKSKNANCGLLTKRQLYFGILDQTMHSIEDSNGVNTAELCQELQPKIMNIEAQKGTNFVASFGHLAGGYDAQYYGYMWSQVYSADMFDTVFCQNGDDSLMDAENGMNYRQKILAPGGSRDAMDSLRDFLGREPNNEAFLKDKGL